MKMKDSYLLWLIFIFAFIVVGTGAITLAGALPSIALPIILVGAVIVLVWIFGCGRQPSE